MSLVPRAFILHCCGRFASLTSLFIYSLCSRNNIGHLSLPFYWRRKFESVQISSYTPCRNSTESLVPLFMFRKVIAKIDVWRQWHGHVSRVFIGLENWFLYRAIPVCRRWILRFSYVSLQYHEICGNLTLLNNAPGYSLEPHLDVFNWITFPPLFQGHSHELDFSRIVLKRILIRCNCMQVFIYCKITLHVSGVYMSSNNRTSRRHLLENIFIFMVPRIVLNTN